MNASRDTRRETDAQRLALCGVAAFGLRNVVLLAACGLLSYAQCAGAEIDESKIPPAAQVTVDFERDIRPIFEQACFRCHGAEKPKSRFSLVTREAALKGGSHGVDILPGQSAGSPLIHYVSRLVEDLEMPPEGKGDPLTGEQIGLLRAWIDQGVKWSGDGGDAGPRTRFSMTPTVRWITVSGDQRKFREHTGLKEGWGGGAQDFHLEQHMRLGEKLTLDGSILAEPEEYRLRLEYEKNDVGFVRSGFEQFRRYYDDTGGYYQPFDPSSFSLGKDLGMDVGRAWIDFGLTLPKWPRMVLGYEYQYKEGTKSSLAWSEVYELPEDGDFVGRGIYPAYKDIDEHVHILKFDISHTIAGVGLEDNLRVEFYDLSTRQVMRDAVELGQPLPDSATSVREDYDHVEVVNAFRGEKEIRDWLFVSGGYLYSKINADASLNVASVSWLDPSVALADPDRTDPIVIRRNSHVFNFNSRLGPWENLTFTAGVQNEWTHDQGFGQGTQTTDPHNYEFDRDLVQVDEAFDLRYTGLPFTVLYADTRFQQQWISQYEQDIYNFIGSESDFLRDTDARADLFQYRAGFTVSPWKSVLLESSYKHRNRQSDYDHLTDTFPPAGAVPGYEPPVVEPPDYPGNGYPAFITSRDIDLDEIEAKVAVRPASWLKTTFKYQHVSTDYTTRTDPSVLRGTTDSYPGGSITAGNYDANVYSVNATITPWRRLYLATTFSYSDARTVSGVNGLAGTVPYEGDIYSVITSANYILDSKTDWFTSYAFSRADYEQSEKSASFPLGITYQRHGIVTGISRRFRKNLTARLQYGFFHYDEPSTGGVNNYIAHSIAGSLTMVFR